MCPRRRRDLTLTEIEQTGESVLVDARGERATVITPLAAVVWLLCDGARGEEAIGDEIAAHFGAAVDRARVDADVRAVLGAFAREGLLEP